MSMHEQSPPQVTKSPFYTLSRREKRWLNAFNSVPVEKLSLRTIKAFARYKYKVSSSEDLLAHVRERLASAYGFTSIPQGKSIEQENLDRNLSTFVELEKLGIDPEKAFAEYQAFHADEKLSPYVIPQFAGQFHVEFFHFVWEAKDAAKYNKNQGPLINDAILCIQPERWKEVHSQFSSLWLTKQFENMTPKSKGTSKVEKSRIRKAYGFTKRTAAKTARGAIKAAKKTANALS